MPRDENNWSVVIKVMQGKYKQTFGPYILSGYYRTVKQVALQRMCTEEYEDRFTPERLQHNARVTVDARVYRD